MLDIEGKWGFSIPSVSITIELKIVTPLLHEIAMSWPPSRGLPHTTSYGRGC